MVSRQGKLLSPLETHSQIWQGLVFKRVNSCHLFCHHPLRGKNATSAFHHRRIWQPVDTWHWLPWQGPGQPHQSSSCHQEHEVSTGVSSSNNSLWFQTPGKASWLFWLFFILLWFALLPLIFWIRISFALACLWFICLVCCFLWLQKLSNEVRAIQFLFWFPCVILIWEPLPP